MNGSLKLLFPFLARQWRALVVAAGATVVVAAADVLRPFPLALVVDHLFDPGRARPFELTSSDILLLAAVAALVLGIALADALASYQMDVRLGRAGERIVHDLRVAIYAHLQRLSLSFHERRHTGDLVTRLTGDVNAVGDLFSSSLGTLVSAVLTIAGMLVVSVLIDPILALAAFAVSPVLAFVTFRYRRTMRMLARHQRAKEADIAALANEALSSAREVKAFGTERFEHVRLRQASEDRLEAGLAAARVQSRFSRHIDLLGAVATTVVLVVGVVRVAAGALSPGELVVMAAYARRIYRPLRDIARESGRVSKAMARADRIGEILAADDLLEDRGRISPTSRAHGDVEFRSVSFGYDNARPVLRDLSLHLEAGERCVVVGRSGAGKSTLAALLARFYDPWGGEVLIDGREAREYSLSWLRGQVGLVLQDSVLFTGTVAENIAYGVRASRDEIEAAAKAAGAHAFVSELPEGYDAVLGPRGVGLSGGQRQRIAVARTLLRDSPILILDEPTTGLDPESEAQVLAGLDVLMRGRTTLIITHSPALAQTADRVVVVEDGRIAREGSPSTVLPALGHAVAPVKRVGVRDVAPRDAALPQLPQLLDSDAMTPVLQRSLGREAPPVDVRLRYLRYKPGTSLLAQYDVCVDGDWREAVAIIAARANLARRAMKPENLALAEKVDGRSPAATPLAYEPELDTMIQWLPLDLSLPALAEPATQLAQLLAAGGARLPLDVGRTQLLGYKPRRRAVLRLDGHVLKIYAGEREFARAVLGLEAASGVQSLKTPSLKGVLPALRLTAQPLVVGHPPPQALDVAEEAGELLAAVHASRRGTLPGQQLPEVTPAQRLEASAASARLVAALIPRLAPRLEALLERLAAVTPASDAIVLSHGDFHAGQLLDTGVDFALLDFDEICEASPSLDLATYAAHVVWGDEGDLEKAAVALDELAEGYGHRPSNLTWYLATSILGRSPFPFRYLDESWPERVEGMVEAAEGALSL
jgi:ATP-binding cassette, subfamily B, bacterial